MNFQIFIFWVFLVVFGFFLFVKVLRKLAPWLFSGILQNLEEVRERKRVFCFRKKIAAARKKRRFWGMVKKISVGLLVVISLFGFLWFLYIFYHYYQSGFGCRP